MVEQYTIQLLHYGSNCLQVNYIFHACSKKLFEIPKFIILDMYSPRNQKVWTVYVIVDKNLNSEPTK